MTVEYRDETEFTGDNHTSTELANAIRTKKHGKDVREPIAQLADKLDSAIKGQNIGSVVATPTKTFANLSALQSAYPNGADGVMVTTDNGHKYFWQSDSWVDGGVYQSTGLSDSQIYQFSGVQPAIINIAENATSEGNGNFWVFHKKIFSGFVDTISAYNNSSQADGLLAIYRYSDDKLMYTFNKNGSGKVDFNINLDLDFDFYIGLKFDKFLYDNVSGEGFKSSGTLTPQLASDASWNTGSSYQAKIDVVYKQKYDSIRDSDNLNRSHKKIVAQNAQSVGNANFWVFKKTYDAGFVRSVKLFNDGTSSAAAVSIFSAEDDSLLFTAESQGASEVSVEINKMLPNFYLGLKFDKFLFDNYSGEGFKSNGTLTPQNTYAVDWNTSPLYQAKAEITYDPFAKGVVESLKTNNRNYYHNRMIVVGDSIVAGYPSDSNWTTALEQLGWNVERGAKTGAGWQYVAGEKSGRWMADNVSWGDYDVAIIAFGTNDYGNNIPIGTENDTAETVSLVGAIKYTLSKIETVNPNIKIICIGPINRADHGTLSTQYAVNQPNETGKTLLDYANTIKREVEKFEISYIDNLTTKQPFSLNTMGEKLVDRLHPTPFGYQLLGASNAAKIDSVIKPF